MLEWRRAHGDEVVATVAHFLSTPYPIVRRTPISLLLRYYQQTVNIARIYVPRVR